MTPELAAALVALLVAAVNELRRFLDQRARQRGEKRTRRVDGSPR